MFADTGVPLLFEEMYKLSCRKADLIVKVVGGANIHDENGTFEIGRRNYVILRKMFWKVGVSVLAEDVGGSVSRTARLSLATGKTTVRRSDQRQEEEL
jgi:chemotaxis protein CheD